MSCKDYEEHGMESCYHCPCYDDCWGDCSVQCLEFKAHGYEACKHCALNDI